MVVRLLKRIREPLTFAAVGAAGFVVDSLVLYLCMSQLGLYGGRIVSFLVAVTFTWWMNRTYTFKVPGTASHQFRLVKEWFRFVSVNAFGASVNLGVYVALVSTVALAAEHPILAVAAGSLSGMVLNYLGSKHAVFRRDARIAAT
ncbi:MAG: GtrA-like protein [Rhodospirillales bacterium]|nr:GtrA-like protein [Rhodospirillales bacterium]